MKTKVLGIAMLVFIMSFGTVIAGNNDIVEKIRIVGNDIGIKMQTAGWVVVKGATNPKRADRILAIALTLLNTGAQTGIFDDYYSGFDWQGISNVKEITVLAASTMMPSTN